MFIYTFYYIFVFINRLKVFIKVSGLTSPTQTFNMPCHDYKA